MIREFEKLQSEYNSQTAVLSDLTDNSKLEFQYMQQDRENKLKGLQFLQGIQEKQQAQQFEQEKFKYQQEQDKLKMGQQKFDLKFDPIT